MKKLFGTILCLMLLAGVAMPTWAQGRGRSCAPRQQSRRYENNYRRSSYDRNAGYNRSSNARRNGYNRNSGYDRRYDNRSFWQRHRDKLTVAGGTGAGAAIGGITGGKKGAAIGALLGAGGSALYTYKLRNRRNNR